MGVRDVLADIATAAQLSGLHAIMLIALAARHLRIPQCKRECAKLEACARRLHALLRWPATGQEIVIRHPAVAGLAVAALVEAAGLVGSYRRSTLWRRARTGRSTETRLRDMRSHIDYLCALVLCVHANLLTQQPAAHHPSVTREIFYDNGGGAAAEGAQTSATPDSGGGADNHQPGGFEAV